VSPLILVTVTIYTFMAFALSMADFVEWLWDFSTHHLKLSEQINSRGVKPYVHNL
jgi:GH15 family glucan-1,4-alpha-glucosidase